MNYIDLLNYLTDVQKIEKEDLAELIGIPQKKMDSVLCGAVSFKKKWLKNLSLYTGIPKEAILAGNFVLNAPEGELAPVVKDAYVPEAIRQGNTQRLNAYVKKRYNLFYGDAMGFPPLFIFVSAVCLLILVGMVFLFEVLAVTDLLKIMLMGILPVIMSFSVMRASIKFARKGVLADERTFKFYAVLAVVQTLISTIAALAFEWQTAVGLVATIGAVLPLIYLVFVQGNNGRVAYVKTLMLAIVLGSLMLCATFCFFTGEKVETTENVQQVASSIIVFTCGWLACLGSLGSVFVSYCFFRKRNDASKHFGPVVKKPVFKGNKIAKSVVAVVLVAILFFSTIYIAPILLVDGLMSTAMDKYNGENVETQYLDYNKGDITFAEDEQVMIVEKENYRIKLPAYLEKNENVTTRDGFQNKEKLTVVFIENTVLDYSDVFIYDGDDEKKREANEKLNKAIEERYGFIPKGQYEYFKLLKLISEDSISPFNRDLSLAVSLFTNVSQMLANDKVYLYEDSEKCFCICENSFERNDSQFTYNYSINGNAKGDYDKFFSISVIVVSDSAADMDLPFKIINSIEMK